MPLEHGVGLEGMVEQAEQVVAVERIEDIDLRATQQRTDDLERRVLGGGTYERDSALLHGAEQGVLLRLVEAMYLVDEQNGPPLAEDAARIGSAAVQHLAHLFHPTGDGAQRVKWHLGLLGNDASQRGLAHTGRPPQDERRDVAALYHAAYHRALAHEVPLPYVVVERLGTQTLGKWLIHDKSR